MTPNTKLGLLVGLLFIIGIGMVLSGQVNRRPAKAIERQNGLASLEPPAPPAPPVVKRTEQRVAAAAPVARPDRAVAGERSRAELMATDEPAGPAGPAALGDAVRPPDRSLADPYKSLPMPLPLPEPAKVAIGEVRPLPAPTPTVDNRIAAGPLDAPALPPGWTSHKVAAGDTLRTISTKYFQTCKKADTIYQANRDKLTDADRLKVGMELRIPPVAAAAAVAAAATPPGPAVADRPTVAERPAPAPAPAVIDRPADRGLPRRLMDSGMFERVPLDRTPMVAHPTAAGRAGATYQVKDGDTLSSIAAEKLGGCGQWRALWQANKDVVPDPDNLTAGAILRLPETRVALQDQ